MSQRAVAAGLVGVLFAAVAGCSFDGSSPPTSLAPAADARGDEVDADGLGSDAAPACVDLDGDGFFVAVGADACGELLDCDDDDDRAFPGQTAFFVLPRASGSFDFDCDGDEERRDDGRGSTCRFEWFDCVGTGWLEVPPPCGESALFHECGVEGLACVEVLRDAASMACR